MRTITLEFRMFIIDGPGTSQAQRRVGVVYWVAGNGGHFLKLRIFKSGVPLAYQIVLISIHVFGLFIMSYLR